MGPAPEATTRETCTGRKRAPGASEQQRPRRAMRFIAKSAHEEVALVRSRRSRYHVCKVAPSVRVPALPVKPLRSWAESAAALLEQLDQTHQRTTDACAEVVYGRVRVGSARRDIEVQPAQSARCFSGAAGRASTQRCIQERARSLGGQRHAPIRQDVVGTANALPHRAAGGQSRPRLWRAVQRGRPWLHRVCHRPESPAERIPARGTRRVRLVRGEGRGVSTWYEGGGGDTARCPAGS